MSDSVIAEQRGHAFWLTINRPEQRNAINEAVISELSEGVRRALGNSAIRAIVLTGAGDRAFSAGGDLSLSADGSPFTTDPANPRNYVADFFRLLENCNLPIIARVNGAAVAGGLGLVCASDMAVAVETAAFGTPESKIGLFPMMILPYLMRVIPPRQLMEMCMTGEPLDAQQALAAGIVNYVVPKAELDSKLEWLIERAVTSSPTGIRLGKMAFHAMQDMHIREALDYAQLLVPTMSRTEDAKEGFAAFRDKRAPVWTGK
jgi:enoyl-CoA hydratase/carnithine racemase